MYKTDEKTGIKYFEEAEVWLFGQAVPCSDNILKCFEQYGLTLPGRCLPDELDPDSDHATTILSEISGRFCYMSFNEKAKTSSHLAYMDNITKRKDFSLLEKSFFTLHFRGLSRGVVFEFIRHRFLSPSQQSTRYVDEKELCFVVPPLEEDLPGFLEDCKDRFDKYVNKVDAFSAWMDAFFVSKLLGRKTERKMARGFARQYLPHDLEAPITMSGNGRAWREMLEKRYDPLAETEFFLLAKKIYDLLLSVAPYLFIDFRVPELTGDSEAKAIEDICTHIISARKKTSGK